MEKLKENIEKNLNVKKEEITDNGDESITFLLEETKVTVDKDGKVELGERIVVIKATKIEVENLVIEEGIKTGKLKVTTTPSGITENLIYTSKNPEVITVDNEGNVTVKGEGETQVEVEGEESGVKGECTVTVEFGVGVYVRGENKSYTNNGTVIIPVGFCIVPGCNNVSEGLVISDNDEDTEVDKNNLVAKGNQFVWVPVSVSAENYKVNENYEVIGISKATQYDTDYLPESLKQSGKSDFEVEKDLVINSEVKGFYVSRYEAGKETVNGVDKLVSKKGATVWGYVTPEECKNNAKEYEAINNAYVNSAIISGVQWDMMMAFINGKKDGIGNDYIVSQASSDRHKGAEIRVEVSGNNEADKVCNIYDLEGNCCEYIAEKNTYSVPGPWVERGGYFMETNRMGWSGGPEYPGCASLRSYAAGYADPNTTFRFVLYI